MSPATLASTCMAVAGLRLARHGKTMGKSWENHGKTNQNGGFTSACGIGFMGTHLFYEFKAVNWGMFPPIFSKVVGIDAKNNP